jgi:hypothetical protein
MKKFRATMKSIAVDTPPSTDSAIPIVPVLGLENITVLIFQPLPFGFGLQTPY